MAQVKGSHGSGGATHSAPRSKVQQIIDGAKESVKRLKDSGVLKQMFGWPSKEEWSDFFDNKKGGPILNALNIPTENSADNVGLLNGIIDSSSGDNSDPWKGLYDSMYSSQKQLMLDNSAEAERLWNLQKDWQTEMSNTAHQREAADLRAAGFNPVLTAIGGGMGQGASTGGSTANPSFAPMQSNDTADMILAIGSVVSSLVNDVKRFK